MAQAKSTRALLARAAENHVNSHYGIGESLNLLRNATLELVEKQDRAPYETLMPLLEIRYPREAGSGVYTLESGIALIYCDQIISLLKSSEMPESKAGRNKQGALQRVIPDSKKVFVVHG